jgi:hypothetical protein
LSLLEIGVDPCSSGRQLDELVPRQHRLQFRIDVDAGSQPANELSHDVDVAGGVSSIGMRTPIEYETLHQTLTVA